MTQRTTKEALDWYENQRRINSRAWGRLCLKAVRTARGIPPMFASAVAAQAATPREDRIYDLDKIKVGMVGFFDDPNDSNKFGHVATCRGRAKDGELLWWSNDVKEFGALDVVRHSFFERFWTDPFVFAATSINGVDLRLDAPKPPKPALKDPKAIRDTIQEISQALDRLNDSIKFHTRKDHPKLVRELKKDRDRLLKTRNHLRDTIEKFD